MFFPSRIYASHTRVIGHSIYRQHVGCGPGIDGVLVGVAAQIIEARDHGLLQPLIDDVLPPEIAHPVLHPLEVADGDAAGVGEDVGDDEDPLVVEQRIGGRRRRPVRALGDDAGAHAVRVLAGDDVLQRRRHQTDRAHDRSASADPIVHWETGKPAVFLCVFVELAADAERAPWVNGQLIRVNARGDAHGVRAADGYRLGAGSRRVDGGVEGRVVRRSLPGGGVVPITALGRPVVQPVQRVYFEVVQLDGRAPVREGEFKVGH